MKKDIVTPSEVDPAVQARFYDFIGQIPESEAAWAQRQATLRSWRLDAAFQPYWPTIDHMLSDDFASFRSRAAAMEAATATAGELEAYDFDAWRQQREYDLKHALDHLP